MHLIAIAWIYVVLMMAIAEALSSQGTVLGAVFTLLLYGVLPLGIVLYIVLTPARKKALRLAEQREAAAAAGGGPESATPSAAPSAAPSAVPSAAPSAPPSATPLATASSAPDGSRHATGDAVAAERKEA